jgi:hypothetical protein
LNRIIGFFANACATQNRFLLLLRRLSVMLRHGFQTEDE